MIRAMDKKAFKEVYVILEYLEDEDFEKIPLDVIEAIENNMDTEYEYEMNEDIDLASQETLPETRAILYNLFRDYLCEPWQKTKIIRMQNEERQKNELKKQEKYSLNVFENKEELKEVTKENTNSTELIKYEESFFKRIIKFIKRIF